MSAQLFPGLSQLSAAWVGENPSGEDQSLLGSCFPTADLSFAEQGQTHWCTS